MKISTNTLRVAIATVIAFFLVGCTIPQTAAFKEDGFAVDGPGSTKNQADYQTPDGRRVRLNTDGYPYAIEYGEEFGLAIQGNGPTRFVGATLPGGINVTIASETDYGWDSAVGDYDPEAGTFQFTINGFRSDASSVTAQAAAVLAVKVPAWNTMTSEQRAALVSTTETIVAGGVGIVEAAVQAAELFATGGGAALIPE